MTVEVDEIVLAVEVHCPRGGAPYPAVILCHGIPAGRPANGDPGYRPLAERLGELGFLVVLFNFRGCGDSGGNIDLAGWCRDLSAMIDLVAGRDDVDQTRISLLGFSGGAATSVKVAATDHRVAAVGLMACPAELSFLFKQEELAEMIAKARQIGSIRDADFPADPKSWLAGLYSVRAEDYVGQIAPRPLLIVHGMADEVVPVEHAKLLYERAGEPKELVLLAGVLHRLRQEPVALTAAVGWLCGVNQIEVNEGGIMMIQVGLTGKAVMVVAQGNTAIEVGSGSVPVFATPMLVAIMENAAINALDGLLPVGQSSVGTKIDVAHTAATPIGMTVTASALLIEVDGRRLVFQILAEDDTGAVGKGTHERVIIDLEKFMAKVNAKKA